MKVRKSVFNLKAKSSSDINEINDSLGKLELEQRHWNTMKMLAQSNEIDSSLKAEELFNNVINNDMSVNLEFCIDYIKAMGGSGSSTIATLFKSNPSFNYNDYNNNNNNNNKMLSGNIMREIDINSPDRACIALDKVLRYNNNKGHVGMYNAAISSIVTVSSVIKNDAVKLSKLLYNRMISNQISPNHDTWNMLMAIWAAEGYSDGIDTLLQLSMPQGLNLKDVKDVEKKSKSNAEDAWTTEFAAPVVTIGTPIISIASDEYRIALNHLCQSKHASEGDIPRGELIISQMKALGYDLNSEDYHALILLNALRVGDEAVYAIQKTIRSMQVDNVKVSLPSYLVLIETYCSTARYYESQANIAEDPMDASSAYSRARKLATRAGDFYMTLEMDSDKENENKESSSINKSKSKIRSEVADGDSNEHETAPFGRLATQMGRTGAIVVDALCRCGVGDQARAILDFMINKAIPTEVGLWNNILASVTSIRANTNHNSDNNNNNDNDRSSEISTNKDVSSSLVPLSYLDLDDVHHLRSRMKELKVPADRWTFATLITIYCRSEQPHRALDAFYEASKEGMQLDTATHAILLETLSEINEDEDANEISKEVSSVFVSMCRASAGSAGASRTTSRSSNIRGVDSNSMSVGLSSFVSMTMASNTRALPSVGSSDGQSTSPVRHECEVTLDMLRKKSNHVTRDMYHALFELWSLRPTAAIAERGSMLFSRMPSFIEPTEQTYILLMRLWSACGQPFGPERVSELASYMQAMGLEPSIHVFELQLESWLRSQRFDAPKRCEEVFRSMIRVNIVPSKLSLLLLMTAWAQSRLPMAVKKCWEVIAIMESTKGLSMQVPPPLLATAASSMLLKRGSSSSSSSSSEESQTPIDDIDDTSSHSLASIWGGVSDGQQRLRQLLVKAYSWMDLMEIQNESSIDQSDISTSSTAPAAPVEMNKELASIAFELWSRMCSSHLVYSLNMKKDIWKQATELLLRLSKSGTRIPDRRTFKHIAIVFRTCVHIEGEEGKESEGELDGVSEAVRLVRSQIEDSASITPTSTPSAVHKSEYAHPWLIAFNLMLADAASDVVEQIFEQQLAANPTLEPDVVSYNILLDRLGSYISTTTTASTSITGVKEKKDENVRRMELTKKLDKILTSMQMTTAPNHETFGIVSSIWDHLQLTDIDMTDPEIQIALQDMNMNARSIDVDMDAVVDKWQSQRLIRMEKLFDVVESTSASTISGTSTISSNETDNDVAFEAVSEQLVRSRSSDRSEVASYLTMVRALCAARTDSSIEKATTLAFKMAQRKGKGLSGSITVPAVVMDAVIGAWIGIGARERAVLFYSELLDNAKVQPSPSTCLKIITALTSTPRSVANIRRAEQVYDLSIAAGMRHDARVVQRILRAWALTANPIAPQQTERFLLTCISRGLVPTVDLFNVVFDSYSKSGVVDAPETVERLLFEKLPEMKVKPDVVSYNTAMAAWARSGRQEAFERSERIFLALDNDSGLMPDRVSFTSLLSALSKTEDGGGGRRRKGNGNKIAWKSKSSQKQKQNQKYKRNDNNIGDINDQGQGQVTGKSRTRAMAAEIGSKIFQEMIRRGIRPDRQTWTILIGLWAKHDPVKAQEIFNHMCKAGEDVAPSTVAYTTMLNVWSSSDLPEASDRVIELFREMKANGHSLDTVGYTSLISAVGRSGEENAPTKAIDIFEQMKESRVRPDQQTYSVLISIMAKASQQAAAMNIYQEMQDCGIRPNVITVTTLLNMWGGSHGHSSNNHYYNGNNNDNGRGYTQAVASIDNLLDTIYEADWVPDGRLLKSLQRALSRHYSKAVTARRLESLLLRTISFGGKPDVMSFQVVLTAWTHYIARDKSWSRSSSSNSTDNVNDIQLTYDGSSNNKDSAVERCVAILDLMSTQGFHPTKSLFQNVLSEVANVKGCSVLEPDNASSSSSRSSSRRRVRNVPAEYTTVLQAYRRAGYKLTTRLLNQLLFVHICNYQGTESLLACRGVVRGMLRKSASASEIQQHTQPIRQEQIQKVSQPDHFTLKNVQSLVKLSVRDPEMVQLQSELEQYMQN